MASLPQKKNNIGYVLGMGSGLGFVLAFPLVLTILLGVMIDKKLETFPIALIISVLIGIGLAPAIAIALIGSKGSEAIGRNPEAASKVQTSMILSIAFAEAIAIYALVVALIILFV
ncbi:MAG: ATPase, F0/V0 complex, subunit C [Parcubacteria bacterium 34_609]|nr:MAG: ATPase, F0/V0 complex, subunit C [Parcubacteria bacterium 34_609]